MQTIKTFVVIALLMAVCYGAFVALNAPDISIPEELELWANSSGENSLDEFQIPQFNVPETFAATQDSPNWSAGSALEPASPQSSNVPAGDLPQFPEFDLPAASPENLVADSSSLAEDLRPQTLENDAKENTWDLPSISGAQLTSRASSDSPDSKENLDGPAIAFNPNTMPESSGGLEESAVNDLINAGASFLDSPAAEDPLSDLDASSASGLPASPSMEDLAFDLATPKKDSLENDPNQLNSAGASTGLAANLDSNQSGMSSGGSESLPALSVAKAQALEKAQKGNLSEALEMMSQYYETVELDYAEHNDLVDLLDALSREVIYSNRPLMGPAFQVTAQDTLQSIAEKHRINPELLAAINKLGDSQALIPNSQLKVFEGPFRAQVSLSRGELTVFLGKMYAGRFPVSISSENKPSAGTYEIVDRRRDRTFYGTDTVIPATAPTNPFGGYWLSLGGNLSIHGSPEQVTSDLEGAGCISLAPLDAADVYRILSKGSSVEIRP